MAQIKAVIFDLGNVLVDWSPFDFFLDHGYSQQDAQALLDGPVSLQWHGRSDCGLPMAENVRQRIQQYPAHESALTLYLDHWQDTIRGEIAPTVSCLEALAAAHVPLYALTNFPADTYAPFFERFAFMQLFRDVIVSGEVGLKKPDPRIFALAADRFGVSAQHTVFIDDRLENCAAAQQLGFHTHHFVDPKALSLDLQSLGLI